MPMNLRTCMLALLVPLALPAWSADDLMTQYLVEQAHAWEQKDRPDLALEIWQKILLGNPKHSEALRKLSHTNGKNTLPPSIDLPPQPVIIRNRQPVEFTPPTVQPHTTRPAIKVLAPNPVRAKIDVATPASAAVRVPDATVKEDAAPAPADVAVESDRPVPASVSRAVVLPKLERLKLKPSNTLELLPAARSR